jgi:hypothetical protein
MYIGQRSLGPDSEDETRNTKTSDNPVIPVVV